MNKKEERLIEAAIELFQADGFWNVSTAKISKQADVATGTLFNYFSTKDELIDAVFTTIREELVVYILTEHPDDGSVKDQLEHIWFRLVDWCIKNPEKNKINTQLRVLSAVSKETRMMREDDFELLLALYDRGVAEEIFLPGLTGHFVTAHFQSSAGAVVSHALSFGLQDNLAPTLRAARCRAARYRPYRYKTSARPGLPFDEAQEPAAGLRDDAHPTGLAYPKQENTLFPHRLLIRGSNASRRPSPSILKQIAVRKMNSPGNAVTHQASRM